MNDFDKGFEFSARHAVAVPAGMDAASWVNSVEAAIEELYSAMNSYDHYKNSKAAQDSLKGFLAEEWSFGTANVDAAVKRVDAKGIRLDSHDLGSADVAWGVDQYQLKFLTDPKNIARKLATTLRDSYNARPKRYADLSFDKWAAEKGFAGKTPDDLLYGDMGGLIPSDKLEAAKQYTLMRIERAKGRGLNEEVRRWMKVRDNLTDRIKTPEGVEGRPATNEEMRRKAVDVSNKKELDPADDGMTTSQLIAASDIVKQSLKAGGAAAALSAALAVAPEIYRAIDYLIAEGEIDDEHLKSIGTAACVGAANGFVSGSATAAITAAAAKGAFGGTVKAAAMGSRGANVIAALVVLTMEMCRNSYLAASGRIEPVEMASNMGQSVFSTVMMFGGATVATALTGGATFPVLIGSFVGGAVGSMAFKPVSSCVMKVCVDSGVTFFGLVEQDYEVPKRLLSRLGIKGTSIKTARIKTVGVSMTPRLSAPSVKTTGLHTADVVFFERGFVGVNKVAYS